MLQHNKKDTSVHVMVAKAGEIQGARMGDRGVETRQWRSFGIAQCCSEWRGWVGAKRARAYASGLDVLGRRGQGGRNPTRNPSIFYKKKKMQLFIF